MGLLNFLKNKFSKKDKQETSKQEENKSEREISNLNIENLKQEDISKVLEQSLDKLPKETKREIESEDKVNSNQEIAEQKSSLEAFKEDEPSLVTQTSRDEVTRAYVKGLKKSNKGFMFKLKKLTSIFKHVDESYFEELEQILIEADVGVELSLNLVDKTKKLAKINNLTNPTQINELLIDEMFTSYQKEETNLPKDIEFQKDRPTVLLVVGVNGVGKTTTIAKLAKRYKDQGKKVLLVAGDTFRAGAVEQLTIWANRIGVSILVGKQGSDPSSLCYDGLTKAKNENYDLVIVDTAGRLQNKANLMDELAKMKRVMSKVIPSTPDETFLIIDANTGQNGVEQARVFKEVTPISGIVITKMDGTSKGGIILAIRDKLGIPVRFIGLGEGLDDLKEFDLDSYLYGLLIGEEL